MAEDRWDKVGELLEEAREVPPDERAAFLEEACEEEAVREEVLSLLRAEDGAGGFFEDLAQAVLSGLGEEKPGEAELRVSDPLDLEGARVGRYAVEEHLGGGGMGVVYRGRDTQLDRPVALKFLPPYLAASEEAEKRFVREAKAAAALDHPHIARVHEIGETGEGRRFISMAYYEGETLKEKIDREGPLPIEEALGYAEQIAEALSRAHEAGIVHRDVKPANVMVTEAGEAKLLDFGLVRIAGRSQLTEPGRRLGTAAYMSPEQAEGKEVDGRTDLWALGALLYEMLAGERPFRSERPAAVIHSILHEEPSSLRSHRAEVPAEVEQVVHRCLRKEPAERYASAEAFLEELQSLQTGPTESAGEQLVEGAREGSAGGSLSWLWRFVGELRRRRVLRVAAVYAGTAFVILQLGEILVEPFGLPGWTLRLVTFLLILGFPLAVGLAWTFDVTEEGLVRTRRRAPAVEGATAGGKPFTSNGLIVALLLLAIGLFLYPRVFTGEEPATGQAPAVEAEAGRSVAVLPFEVSGSGAQEWQDGMVTALSLNLDGAAGLRAIADRTVFAAWKKQDSAEAGASTEDALAVARDVGARYAVVGSAVQLGEDLRFGAEVRRAATGKRLGKVEVRGSPESITALTDRLTREVLGVLLEKSEERVPSVDLASITTESLGAFKAFLEGERHFRDSKFEVAAEDFEAAIRRDSAFALAHARLGLLNLWLHQGRIHHVRRAQELSSQLPERTRRLIEALYVGRVEHRPLEAADRFRALTEDYPDDPEVWYIFGEFLYHANIPRGVPEYEKAFERAIALDPGNAAYHLHYTEAAFTYHHDSTVVADRIERMPEGRWRRMFRFNLGLLFGTPDQRERALRRLDTLSIPAPWLLFWSLFHPTELALMDTVDRRLGKRDDLLKHLFGLTDPIYDLILVRNEFHMGKIGRALTDLNRRELGPESSSFLLARAMSLGYPIPDSASHRYLALENLPPDPSPKRLYRTMIYLIEEGRGEELGPLFERLRSASDTTGNGGFSAERIDAVVEELRGYRALRAGNLQRAKRLLSRSNEYGHGGAIWRGDLYRKLGRLEKAEGWYQVAWRHPVAHERLGWLYEEMGRPEKAAAAYRRFVEAWEEADPELQNRVAAARERLQTLHEKRPAE